MWKIILIIITLLYALSPYDLVPDMMIGWGWIDDLAILGFLWRYFYIRKRKREALKNYYQSSRNAFGDANSRGTDGRSEFRSNKNAGEFFAENDPYRILGIESGATQAELKRAYRQLAGKYHPDKVEHLGDEFKTLAEKRFKEIQQAYQKLKLK